MPEGIDWGQLGKGLIGQSDRQVLSRESDKYTGPGTSVKRTGIEQVMDGIFRAGSSESLNDLSKDKYVTRLKETYGTDLELLDPSIRSDLNLTNRSGINATMSEADVARQIQDGQRLQEVRRRAKATRGTTPEDYAGTDVDVIEQNIQTAATEQKNTDYRESPITQKADDRYADAQKLQALMLNNQMTQQQNNFSLQQSQLQLQNRREDAREARGERKDRQMMIMQMMKGLSQMGASIAI